MVKLSGKAVTPLYLKSSVPNVSFCTFVLLYLRLYYLFVCLFLYSDTMSILI